MKQYLFQMLPLCRFVLLIHQEWNWDLQENLIIFRLQDFVDLMIIYKWVKMYFRYHYMSVLSSLSSSLVSVCLVPVGLCFPIIFGTSYQIIIFFDRDIWKVQITVVKLFSHVEYRKNKIKVSYWTQIWKRESQILFYFFLEGQNYFWGLVVECWGEKKKNNYQQKFQKR